MDAEFLSDVLSKEDVSAEGKIQLILSEHEADKRGLIQKNSELIGAEKKLKEQIAGFVENEKSYTDKISTLEGQLAKNSPEEHKKYYDAQLENKTKEFNAKYDELKAERDFYKTSHIKRMQDDAVAQGIKDLQFVNDFRKKSFINNVLMDNDFEAKEIDGQTVFINKHNKTLQDALKDYATTAEGKDCLKPLTSGGGARGGTSGNTGAKALSREEFEALDPTEKAQFFAKGGKLI